MDNRLSIVRPDLVKEWSDKNFPLTPEDVTFGSHKKVWWKCHMGHEWRASITSRNRGNGCPYCSGLYVIEGETDLQTVNPVLTTEWDFEKNDGIFL